MEGDKTGTNLLLYSTLRFGRSDARGQVDRGGEKMIAMADARSVAEELHDRYEPIRAVTLVARTLQKALFAGRSDDVVFWALVYAHYRGTELRGATEAELAAFREYILPEPDVPGRESARKRRFGS